MSEREDNVYKSQLAEQAERYDEMMASMKIVASLDVELTVEEQNLLSVAFKNAVEARRASWRTISSIEQNEANKADGAKLIMIKAYKTQVEQELKDICNDILSVLDKHLIPGSDTAESKVFYYKMKGDYYRYTAEFVTSDGRKEATEISLLAYEAATDIAMAELPTTHPYRLAVALNFAVFYHEIFSSPDRACLLAKAAYDAAISEIDALSEESYKDSVLIMHQLLHNLSLWKSDTQKVEDDDGGRNPTDTAAVSANGQKKTTLKGGVNNVSEASQTT